MKRPITLVYHPGHRGDYWVVKSVKNSLQFHPNQELLEHEVKRLCVSPLWDVTIVGKAKS